MLYLGTKELLKIGNNWNALVDVISECINVQSQSDFVQPIKPYLRYGDQNNRIIAMPAYVGGEFSMAGIKWIASFPANKQRGLQRAHSVTILNEADSGIPCALFNSTLISEVRTAAVSGCFLKLMLHKINRKKIKVGMTGLGPIGIAHVEMLISIFGDELEEIKIFDIQKQSVTQTALEKFSFGNLKIVDTWQEAYLEADVFITCTVSKERYINLKPKPGSLQLNISLRDFEPNLVKDMNYIVVDDWDEVCRENTDVEQMHREQGLTKHQTLTLSQLPQLNFRPHEVVMFNPMGMAIFDIAVASYYYANALKKEIGITLT
jgi:2,3-diaminopropionate biosynthesis protein SbnB